MLVSVLFGVLAVLSQRITAQFPNFLQDQSYDQSLEESYEQDNELYSDIHLDDNAWLEMQYKIQKQLNANEYSADEDYGKFESVRGIPPEYSSHKITYCTERITGSFKTIEGVGEVYPIRYSNISCERHDGTHHLGHRSIPVMCYSKHGCATTITQLHVYRKVKPNCWKPEQPIPVETGCKCIRIP